MTVMCRGGPDMTSSMPPVLLLDRRACLRAVWALKAGRPPREGVRFLSVGMDRVLDTVDSVLQRAAAGQAVSPLIVRGDYGEGKSHTLRLIAEEARAHEFAWVIVNHDRQQNLGLHKPAWLLRHILWEIRWNYPAIDLSRWDDELSWRPNYRTDRYMRTQLGRNLRYLADDLRSQGLRGLVICLDELENYTLLTSRQKRIFGEVQDHLTDAWEPAVVLLFAMTRSQGVTSIRGQHIYPPALDETAAVAVADRILRLHSVAFDWQPPSSSEKIAERAWECARSVPSGSWRIFVQIVVTLLELLHQNEHPIARHRAAPGAPDTRVPPLEGTLRPAPRALVTPPQPAQPRLQVGDRVEIVGGHFSGWRGRVQAINGQQVHLVVEGRMPTRVRVHASQVRRSRQ